MSKKQDAFYFENYISCAEYAVQAAQMLKDTLMNFKAKEMKKKLDEIHAIEHAADEKNHELMDRLARAFITPIEREDMLALSHNIDDLTDKIEEVFIRIYINQVKSIRPEAVSMLDTVIKCCQEVCGLMKEFADFRHSKDLKEKIIRINTLEEVADQMFIENMHDLHSADSNVLEIIAWREIYSYLEKCADACEEIAVVVGSIVMNNT